MAKKAKSSEELQETVHYQVYEELVEALKLRPIEPSQVRTGDIVLTAVEGNNTQLFLGVVENGSLIQIQHGTTEKKHIRTSAIPLSDKTTSHFVKHVNNWSLLQDAEILFANLTQTFELRLRELPDIEIEPMEDEQYMHPEDVYIVQDKGMVILQLAVNLLDNNSVNIVEDEEGVKTEVPQSNAEKLGINVPDRRIRFFNLSIAQHLAS